MIVSNYCRVGIVVIVTALILTACGEDRSDSKTPLADRAMPPTTGPASGTLVIAGGNVKDAAIIERFLELAGGPGTPIVVVPTAAEGDVYSLEWDYLEPFRDAGATNLTVLHTRDPAEANTPAFVAPLKDARGVWFVGGRQKAIKDGMWQYVEHGNTQFLFDLSTDVGERHNLFYEHTDVVNRLRVDLDAWQESMPR